LEGGRGYGSLAEAAAHLVRLVRPGSLVVVISDFAGVALDTGPWLAELAAGTELMLVLIYDPLEAAVPPPGLYPVSDGQRRGVLDLTRRRSRELYDRPFRVRLETLERLARRHRAHLVELATADPVGPTLALALKARAGARTRGGIP
jgi:hypothetical protein